MLKEHWQEGARARLRGYDWYDVSCCLSVAEAYLHHHRNNAPPGRTVRKVCRACISPAELGYAIIKRSKLSLGKIYLSQFAWLRSDPLRARSRGGSIIWYHTALQRNTKT